MCCGLIQHGGETIENLVYGWDREADRYGYWLIDHGEKHELCESYETIEEAEEAALAAAKEGAK